MENLISFTCDVNITRRENAVEDYVLKSEHGHFNVPKYSDARGEEIVRTISFPSDGDWYLITAGKYLLNNTSSLDVVFCLDGEVKTFNFEENLRFDVPINQTIDAVLHGTFDISYEELPDLIERLKSGFIPPETDADENTQDEGQENLEEDVEVFDLDEEVDEEI